MLRTRTFYAKGGEPVIGQVVYGVIDGAGLYKSEDFGETFEKVTQVQYDHFTSLKIAQNGKVILLVGSKGAQFSNNYGESFQLVPTGSLYNIHCAVSGNGKVGAVIEVDNPRKPSIISLNLGNGSIVKRRFMEIGRALGGIALGEDGTEGVVTMPNTKAVYTVCRESGNVWSYFPLVGDGDINYRLVAMSAINRKVLLAGYTGNYYPPRRKHGSESYYGFDVIGTDVASVGAHVSYDGRTQYLYTERGLYKSSDFGETFLNVPLPGFTNINANYNIGFAVSSDGKHIYLCANPSNMWISNDGGGHFRKVVVTIEGLNRYFSHLATS